MNSGQPRVITLSDLAQLTLRANVAFALRCAQRLRPCFKLPPEAPRRREQISALDAAIRVAATFCRGLPVEAGRAADAVRVAAAVAEETCEFTRFAGYGAVRAAEAAECAEECVRNPNDATVVAVVAAAFGAGRVLASNADVFAHESVVAALFQDMEKLRIVAPGADVDLGAPFDPSETGPLGPLWPAGVPACFALDVQQPAG